MKTIIFFFFLFIINTASSQDNSINVFHVNHAKTLNNNEEYKKGVDDALIFNIDKDLYNSVFEEKKYKINLTIPVSSNRNIYANLERFEILTPDAKIIERSATGEKEVDLRNTVLSYHGKFPGRKIQWSLYHFITGKL